MVLRSPQRLAGVVTISYPLHPPGRPDQLRVDHLPAVAVPWLFVHGTRDPFGTPDELQRWTETVAGPVTHHWIAGGHDLKGKDSEVAAVVADWVRSLPPPASTTTTSRRSPGATRPDLAG